MTILLASLVATSQLQGIHAGANLEYAALAFHTDLIRVKVSAPTPTAVRRKFITDKKDVELEVHELPADAGGRVVKLLFLGSVSRRPGTVKPIVDTDATYVALGRPAIDGRLSFVSVRNVGLPLPGVQPPVWVLTTRGNPDEFAAFGLFPCLSNATLEGSSTITRLAGAIDPASSDSVEEITRVLLSTRISDLGKEQSARAGRILVEKAPQAQGYERSRLMLTAVALGEWHRAEEALWTVVNAEADWQSKERAQILARVNLVPNTRDRTVREVLGSTARNERLLEMSMRARTEPVSSVVIRNMNAGKPDASNAEVLAWMEHVSQFPACQSRVLDLLAAWHKQPDKRPVKGSDPLALLAYWRTRLAG